MDNPTVPEAGNPPAPVTAAPVALEERTKMPVTPTELEQMRFDYAWNWFNFHAEQRTKMFNFMLIGMGIFATAFVTAIDKKLVLESAVVSSAAAVIGLVFYLIDRRNRQLYSAGMDVLIDAEKTVLFGDVQFLDRRGKEQTFGVSRRIAIDDRPSTSEAQDSWRGKLKYRVRSYVDGRHRFWMPFIALGFVTLFAVAALRAWLIYFEAAPRLPVTVMGVLLLVLAIVVLWWKKPPPWGYVLAYALVGLFAIAVAFWVPALSQPVKSTRDVDVVIGGDLNSLLELRFKQPLQDARGAELGLLASARFGPFASGDDSLDCSSRVNTQGVADIRTAFEEAFRRKQRVLLLLVGVTDRMPLSQALRQRYGSDAGLARARVSAAERCLFASDATPPPSDVLRVISGPAYTPASADSSDAARQGMEGDRVVRVVVVGLQAAR
jgi:hypothetical protein